MRKQGSVGPLDPEQKTKRRLVSVLEKEILDGELDEIVTDG
jgi:hypothetical protein